MEIKAVLFDVDGLIFDTKGFYKVSWQNEAREEGFELEDDFYQAFIEGQHAEYERWIAARRGERLDLDLAGGEASHHRLDPLLGY